MMEFYEKCEACNGSGSMKIENGVSWCDECEGEGKITTDALTIEDWFAGKALNDLAGLCNSVEKTAAHAYEIAAAMVAERERRKIGDKTHEDGPG